MKSAIESLIQFEIEKNTIDKRDYFYVKNQIYHLLNLKVDHSNSVKNKINHPQEALDIILDNLEKNNILDGSQTARDLFDAKIMNIFAKKPSEVEALFWSIHKQNSLSATTWYYEYMKALNYIRYDRCLKNYHFKVDSKYGEIELAINLSKPEKDPISIKMAQMEEATSYPKCLLCIENEGFSGNYTRDSRDQHRTIKAELSDGTWYFQYSPYLYYNEHAIIFSETHKPMKTDIDTFNNLLMLTNIFEGYFFGSNADIPIVGGSILSHSHYQGGNYIFPIEKAEKLKTFNNNDIQISILNWPIATIRLESYSMTSIVNYADKLLKSWKKYSNESLNIKANTGETVHHTVTPIARKKDNLYILDVVLRDNHTNEEHPDGVFHSKKDVWHIKKENMGLIEVSGLAILPGRLLKELEDVKLYITKNIPLPEDSIKHLLFADNIKSKYNDIENIDKIIEYEVGQVFIKGLKDCSVFDIEKDINKLVDFIATI